MLVWKFLVNVVFTGVLKARRVRIFSRRIWIFRRFWVWLGHSGLLSIRFLLHPCWVLGLSYAFHYYLLHFTKHPTSVILSCFSFCAKFGPKRTIDIQNQYAHIKGEYYKRSLNFIWLSLIRLKCVVINHQNGGDWRVSCPPKWVLVI
jgi:hypothetical protein